MSHAQTLRLVPQSVNLELYAGDGAAVRITVRDTSGQTIPVDGAVEAQLRDERDSASAIADFAVDTAEAAQGIVRVSLSGAQTAPLGDFSGFWDVQWTPSGEEPVTIVQGKVKCSRDVTR
jgi:hypothetical protein